jgi:ABC-type sugar transport system ATPase subunit
MTGPDSSGFQSPATESSDPHDQVNSLMEVAGLSKSFGVTRALHDFSHQFMKGKVYAVVGENGSGKSTLVKVLSGILPPDHGRIMVSGRVLERFSPRSAILQGVATCHQEVLVEDNLSTLENLFLSDGGWLRPQTKAVTRRQTGTEMLDELSLNPPDLNERVEHLSLAARQLVVIARTLLQPDASILLLDEVTAALDRSDSGRVLEALIRRADEGRAIVFTSHRMDELERIGGEIIVLRNGEIEGILSNSELTFDRLLKLMSGRTVTVNADRGGDVSDESTSSAARGANDGPTMTAVRVTSVKLRESSPPIDLAVSWGQITGLVGLDGHGQAELLKIIGGVTSPIHGKVEMASPSGSFALVTSQRHAVKLGITYLPRDRKNEGIFPTLSVLDNFALPTAAARTRLGFVSSRLTFKAYEPLAKQLAVKAASPRALITSLSGGNQQKVLLARWLAAEPRVVLLDDPTRGVDIGTKYDLYRLLRDLASTGRAVVLVSTELEELVELADRVVVFYSGSITADLKMSGANKVEQEKILTAMLGQSKVDA